MAGCLFNMDKNSKILVTGANGFLGKSLCKNFIEGGYNIVTFSIKDYNLTKEEDVKRLFEKTGPFNTVVHLAAVIGGIDFFKANAGRVYYENVMMNTLMQEYSRLNGVKKFVGLGSVLEYPANTPVPFKEEELWNGFPEKTTSAYGLSKRLLLSQSQFYREQYGMNCIHLILTNLYGPGYNFSQESPHVIPSLIKKFDDAKKLGLDSLTMCGTGKATREFLYVEDAVDAIILAMEKYDNPLPLNIGSGEEVSIKKLAEMIADKVGFNGRLNWDATKPEGKLRSLSDITRLYKELGFKAKTSLSEGIKRTINWYSNNYIKK